MRASETTTKSHGYEDIGYHFYSQRDPKTGKYHLKRGRSTSLQGCHGNPYYNKHGLGYAIAGNFSWVAPTEAEYQHILGSCLRIMRLEHVPKDHAKGHCEVRIDGTECPGTKFPLARLKADIIQCLST